MNRTLKWLVLILFIALTGAACEQLSKLTATKIKDALDRPRDYENKEITVHGTVTESASILIAKYFVLQDGSGSIKVFTDRTLPKAGEQLSVTGHLQSIEFGAERWVVLREKNSKRG
jgi:aspartyl/asparaginyl-tRNA synthetase